MKDFFLFQSKPELSWSRNNRLAYWAWQVVLVILSGLGIGVMSMLLAVGPYGLSLGRGYLERPLILAVNLLPVAAFALFWYGVTRRARQAFAITAVVVLSLSIGNYYKLNFRDDPLMFGDLFLLKEAGNMAGKYRLFLDKKLLAALVCAVGGYLFLRFLVRGRPEKGLGRWTCLLAGAAVLAALTPTLMSDRFYNINTAYYEHLDNRWSATQQYIAHGFVYPFLHSITETIDLPPEDYDRDSVKALLAGYEDADIPADQRVNVIGIMLEAYNDFTKFDIPDLPEEVYAVWHQLEEEGVAGDLVTNIFAGGTVDSERCFLTGYTQLKNYRGPVNSYVWYFRDQGYTAEGLHPCFQWFYNRLNVNQYLGFENYYFVENYFNAFAGDSPAPDYIFFPELLKTYRERTADGTPYFNFSVTYQGHGPYDDQAYYWGDEPPLPDSGAYTTEELNILNNYLGSIQDTNQYLQEFTDALRKEDTPVVLVLFGDHNPWLGDGNSVYQALGVNFDMSDPEGVTNYYGTRYIIWANEAAKQVLGRDIQGEGPAISANFLMNELFRQCGWTGPAYLQATNEVMDRVGVINMPTGLYMEQGELTSTLSEEGAALIREFNSLQYYMRKNFLYGD